VCVRVIVIGTRRLDYAHAHDKGESVTFPEKMKFNKRWAGRMNNSDNDVLLKVFSAVFEGFAFMFVEAEPDLEPDSPGACFQAEIQFTSKENKGLLEVVAPAGLCRELAENILGADGEVLPEGAGESALEEVLNVSCGYLLAEKFGTDRIFDLSIPKARSLPGKKWATLLENPQYSTFLIDDAPMLVRFVLK